MPAVTASAPGKIILFGEHAVVYGRPAIAIPVNQVRAKAVITADPIGKPGQVRLMASDIGLECWLNELAADHPLALTFYEVGAQLGIERFPAIRVKISSTIPIASGLGSGTAITTAVARAVSAFLGHPLENDQVSHIAYVVDQRYHGTPSGIDNTVIAYAQPVFFVRGQSFQHLCARRSFTVVIGNTGISSPTGAVVGEIRSRWQQDRERYERLFDEIGSLTTLARQIIETGSPDDLGPLMTHNHALLQSMDVSSPELDRLVDAAVTAGAGGAKLCGGGRGGNMIALCKPETAPAVDFALRENGAVNTIVTTVQ